MPEAIKDSPILRKLIEMKQTVKTVPQNYREGMGALQESYGSPSVRNISGFDIDDISFKRLLMQALSRQVGKIRGEVIPQVTNQAHGPYNPMDLWEKLKGIYGR